MIQMQKNTMRSTQLMQNYCGQTPPGFNVKKHDEKQTIKYETKNINQD